MALVLLRAVQVVAVLVALAEEPLEIKILVAVAAVAAVQQALGEPVVPVSSLFVIQANIQLLQQPAVQLLQQVMVTPFTSLIVLARLNGRPDMGYFAQIESNIVTQVISVSNNVLGEDTLSFPDTEGAGRAFIANTLGLEGEWRQTSFNASFRYHYAGVGYTFNPDMGEHGAFIPPQPFPSWTLDEDANWQPPIPMPNDSGLYAWNEDAQEWQPVTD